ncbi:hypothetical protein NDU88_010030 [Pleurodeles waltl]|uniref:Uncharacterized protein n=1 Tax=Pleurodeles waltl TaxID=8319 RepID=A0AAV7S040_PLEWA|nr:hypothetical protein NDU88_010030 [Pleurodeles waltl]
MSSDPFGSCEVGRETKIRPSQRTGKKKGRAREGKIHWERRGRSRGARTWPEELPAGPGGPGSRTPDRVRSGLGLCSSGASRHGPGGEGKKLRAWRSADPGPCGVAGPRSETSPGAQELWRALGSRGLRRSPQRRLGRDRPL